MGEHKKARKLLIEADKIVDDLYTVSVSKEAATYLLTNLRRIILGKTLKRWRFIPSLLFFFTDGRIG